MNIDLEVIGWIGSIAFAISALPQAIKSIREGHSIGVSWGLIFFWTVGEWCSLAYVLPMWKWPLIINYLGNIIFCGIVTYYKIWPKIKPLEINPYELYHKCPCGCR